jgi:hypothetical protein
VLFVSPDEPNSDPEEKRGEDPSTPGAHGRPEAAVRPTVGKPLNEQPILAVILSVSLAAGILFPSVWYALVLRPISPSDVLVASSICLFSSIVYLWTLHSISIVQFRDPWMSKAIFGAAITAILASSAATFKAQLSMNPFPLEGTWDLKLERKTEQTEPTGPTTKAQTLCVWAGKVIVAYSPAKNSYVGYAEDQPDLWASCDYGVRAIDHIDWVQSTSTVEVQVSNFAVSDIHTQERQTPKVLTFTVEQHAGRWANKTPVDANPSSAFILRLSRPD